MLLRSKLGAGRGTALRICALERCCGRVEELAWYKSRWWAATRSATRRAGGRAGPEGGTGSCLVSGTVGLGEGNILIWESYPFFRRVAASGKRALVR